MYIKRNNELEVISLFRGDYKTRFYLRQICSLLKIPLKTCQNVLLFLEKNKILKIKIEGKNKYFALNLDNIRTKSYLLQTEIYQTDKFLIKYPQFKLFIKSLKTTFPLIVFGSYGRLSADKNSDIDLLIISKEESINLPYHLLSSKIHKVYLTEKTFFKGLKEHEDLIREIQENHIILNNHSFYVDVMWGQHE